MSSLASAVLLLRVWLLTSMFEEASLEKYDLNNSMMICGWKLILIC